VNPAASPTSFATIGVVAHPMRECSEVVRAIIAWTGERGGRLVTLEGATQVPGSSEHLSHDAFAAAADLVIAAGGDGTILRALAVAAPVRTPVLGVNLGRLGFLAEVDPQELPRALAAIAAGDYSVEERLALDCQLTGGADVVRLRASNDLVLGRTPGRGQAEFAAYIGGELFARYAGDGLIVSTPTGSTAYALSAGGPIVSPVTQAILITALAPHGVFNRSLAIGATELLRVDVLPDSAPVVIECDGWRQSESPPGTQVNVSMSDEPGLLVRLGWTSFYGRARRKLQLVDPLVITGALEV
jgi:NAD+ kinase